MTPITYEHRINPDRPAQVQVRRKPRRAQAGRRHNWNLYMQTDSEADARRILAMLRHQEPESMVHP